MNSSNLTINTSAIQILDKLTTQEAIQQISLTIILLGLAGGIWMVFNWFRKNKLKEKDITKADEEEIEVKMGIHGISVKPIMQQNKLKTQEAQNKMVVNKDMLAKLNKRQDKIVEKDLDMRQRTIEILKKYYEENKDLFGEDRIRDKMLQRYDKRIVIEAIGEEQQEVELPELSPADEVEQEPSEELAVDLPSVNDEGSLDEPEEVPEVAMPQQARMNNLNLAKLSLYGKCPQCGQLRALANVQINHDRVIATCKKCKKRIVATI